MKKTQTLIALLLAFTLAPHPREARAQNESPRRGMTAEDYYSFEFLSDPHLSPDGKWVAYVVTTVDQKQNRRVSNVWLAATDGGRAPRQFTSSPQSSSSPRWSPDGRSLAFLSARPEAAGGSSQSPSSPAPQASPSPTATTIHTGAAGATQTPMPSSSPAGSPPSPTTPGVSSSQLTASAPETPRTQVYLLPLDGGEARRVTNLRNGVSGFQWSPDGTRLAFASDRDGQVEVYVMDDDGSNLARLTNSSGSNKPRWSADGLKIVFTTNRDGNQEIYTMNPDGSSQVNRTNHPGYDSQAGWQPAP
jgi:Tol biopolymer transport system component